MSDELLPCPFCGGAAMCIGLKIDCEIICENCDAAIEAIVDEIDEQLIARWNTRALSPSALDPVTVEALKRIKNFPHNGSASEQAMAAIAREALTGVVTVEPLLKRARQFIADAGCDEDDAEVNAARDELLADIDRALIGQPSGNVDGDTNVGS